MTCVGSISSADARPVSESEVGCLIGHGLPECIALGKAATECEMLAKGSAWAWENRYVAGADRLASFAGWNTG